MKITFPLLALSIAAVWAGPILERDDSCEVVYVDADEAPASASTAGSAAAGPAATKAPVVSNKLTTTTGSGAGNATTGSGSGSTADGHSTAAGNSGITSTNPVNIAGFPVDGEHISAPVPDVAVPADARIFTPSSSDFKGSEFVTWIGEQSKTPPASKWLKVKPGIYTMGDKDCIVFSFMQGINEGWTIDMRETTITVSGTGCQAIYVNQAEDLTIYGGTIWFDGGEIWTQSKVTTVEDVGNGISLVTLVVEEGYDPKPWTGANPRNLYPMDTSNPNHYVRPDNLNFWFSSDMNFDKLISDRTWTMKVTLSACQMKVGYRLNFLTGVNQGNVLASEYTGNLHLNGLTTNGALSQYGLSNGKKTATFENAYVVNPPARPGFAPRSEGPTISFAHIGGFNFVAAGEDPINYVNSFWETTGCEKDLQSQADQELH